MAQISLDINELWLKEAAAVLGTGTAAETINEALRRLALPRQAERIVEALDSVQMDFTGSAGAWRYGGGRDLSRLAEDARTCGVERSAGSR